jgi:polyhydroxybutyrate depolymerase
MISSRNACLAAARSLAMASVLLWLPSCGSSDGGGTTGTGGDKGTGGATSSGGVKGTGGTAQSGGATGTGGVNGTGGTTGTGGTVSTVSTGGTIGTGGSSATGGATGAGGTTSTGGHAGSGSGGSPATGGTTGTGGIQGTGGRAGAAGSGAGGSGTGGSATGGATGTCPATTTLKVGDNNESITSGGESRTFIVRLPTDYTGTSPVPVVIDFHPLGGTGSSQEGSSGWKAKCDSVGCIAVFPDSSKKAGDNSWNAGYCCDNAEKNQINDVQFARDIIKYLETNTCVDPKRIYASGGSNGGGMTYRMACEAADVIAAVAPVDFRCVTGKDPLANAGQVTAASNTACVCTLPRPLSVIAFDEGADTSIVPYAGGQTPSLATDCPPSGSCVGIGFTSAVVNNATWAGFDKCTGSATTDPNNALCKTYSGCADNTQVSLCTTTSGGHLAVYGNTSAKFTDTAWNGLKTQSLP